MDDAAVDAVNSLLADRGADRATVTADGEWLLAQAGEEGVVVDLSTVEERATFAAHRNLGPMPDPTGSAFLTASDGTVEVRALPDAEVRAAFDGEPARAATTGRDLLAPGGAAVYLTLDPAVGWARYAPETGEVEATYGAVEDDEAVSCFALSADGSRAATGGIKGPVSEGFLAYFEAATGELLDHEVCAYEVDQLALSPDGEASVICDGIGGLAGERWRADDLDGVVTDAQYVRDGDEVVSVTYEGTLDRWDAGSGERLGAHGTEVRARSLSATADADLVALSGDRARVVGPGWPRDQAGPRRRRPPRCPRRRRRGVAHTAPGARPLPGPGERRDPRPEHRPVRLASGGRHQRVAGRHQRRADLRRLQPPGLCLRRLGRQRIGRS